MATVSLIRVKKRVISVLMANRLDPYSGEIPTPASNSRYQSTEEIEDAALEADALIVQARISTPGDPYGNSWRAYSPSLANGALIPAHLGAITGAEVADGDIDDDASYQPARFTSSRAEILAMRAHPALYPDSKRWVFIEESIIYHNGDAARVWRPAFTKSDACQAPETDEMAVIAQTLAILPKDGAVTPEIYQAAAQYAEWYISTQIKGLNMALPNVEQIEQQLAA